MKTVDIFVGSMLGASEYVAEALSEVFQQQGLKPNLYFSPDINDLSEESLICICTSTHGAGELPDNIQTFYSQISDTELTNRKYLLVGLGDSSYDTFCGAARQFAQLFEQKGAISLFDPLEIDVLTHPIPEEVACDWLQNNLSSK